MPRTVPGTSVPLLPVLVVVAGGYLAWFAVHYWRDKTTVWPSDPVKAVLTGKGVPAPAPESASDHTLPTSPLGSSEGTAGGPSGGPPVGTPATVTGNYTLSDGEALWTALGGAPEAAQIAGAVMLAESSGDPNVTSPNPDGGTNVGLWQLDTKGVGSGYTVAELQNPETNCRVTIVATQNGTNWNQWQTYATGKYKQFL